MNTLARMLLVLLPLSCASCLSGSSGETVYVPTADVWETAFVRRDYHQAIVECVRPGESVEAWTELFTVQGLDDRLPRRDPVAVMRDLEAEMRARGGKVQWSVIEQGPSDVLYEWTITSAPGLEDQGEIARLIQGEVSMHRAAYAYKRLPLDPERRATTIDVLRRATLVHSKKEYEAAMDAAFPDRVKSR